MSAVPAAGVGGVLDYEDAYRSLSAAYRAAEAELRADLADTVRLIALDPTSSARERAAQQRAVLARVASLRADLEGEAAVFADDTLARIYSDGMARTDRALAAAGVALQGAATFGTVHTDALNVLAADTFEDLARATDALDSSVRRTIREAAKARTAIGAATGASVARDTSALVRRLADQGVVGFVDAAGRGWRMSAYAEMVVRTKSAQAYNTGTVLRATEQGTDVFVISDGERSGHDECLRYSGSTCSGRWALLNPVEHPNCVRSFGPAPLHTGPVEHFVGGEDRVPATPGQPGAGGAPAATGSDPQAPPAPPPVTPSFERFEDAAQGDAWGKAVWQSADAIVTPTERAAFDRYRLGGYAQVNDRLRGTRDIDWYGTPYWPDAGTALTGPGDVVDALDASFDRLPTVPSDVVTYRGVRGRLGQELLDGDVDVFVDNGYLSTSVDPARAASFGANGTVIEMQVPAGTRANYLDAMDWDVDRPEAELMLDRGMVMEVVERDPEARRVVVRIVGQDRDRVQTPDRPGFLPPPGP